MQVMPQAVRRRRDGYYVVDYGVLLTDPAMRTALRRNGHALA
jgi:hypothetical protein